MKTERGIAREIGSIDNSGSGARTAHGCAAKNKQLLSRQQNYPEKPRIYARLAAKIGFVWYRTLQIAALPRRIYPLSMFSTIWALFRIFRFGPKPRPGEATQTISVAI
jgi:hypothetical protein